MKTLKVLLQEVVSGIKAWVNSNFAQESNTVHKTGNETITGDKTFSGESTYTSDNLDFTFTDFTIGDSVNANKIKRLRWFDSANNRYGCIAVNYGTDKSVFMDFPLSTKNTAGTGTVNKTVRFQLNPDNTSAFQPTQNNLTDLGTSAYQWNNLYAKNYYYNGTAWGLDKENVWTGVNTFQGAANCVFNFKFGTSGSYNDIRYYDNNDSNYACLRSKVGNITLGLRYSSASVWYDGASIVLNNDGSVNIKSYDGTDAQLTIFKNTAVYPSVSSVTDLGTSAHKWKTFNGVNPGALSFPNYDDTTYIDISGSIVPPTGETEINKNLENNYYTPPVDGWLSIRCDGAEYLQIYRNTYNCPGVTAGNGTVGIKLVVTLPVRKNVTYSIRIKKTVTGIENYQLYPCLGNV